MRRHRNNTLDRRGFLATDLFHGVLKLCAKTGVSVTLPTTEAATASVSNAIEIVLDTSGTYFVAGEPVGDERDQLLTALRSVVGSLDAQAVGATH